jgi:hypothetical protein
VLFENSIVCLVVLFFCFLPCSDSSCWGVVVCFVRLIFLNVFCLESLILAQDERWRRA